MAAAIQQTQETAIAATELYLSGLGVVNEGLDWIIVVNDVSEGHWESLAAALPFVPAGLVKSGGHLIIRKVSGEVMDSLETTGFHALREFGLNGNLATTGTVYDEFGFSEFLRKGLSSNSGPVAVPTNSKKLGAAMKQILERPSKLHEAHHDFPWAQRNWFADRGIDVNEAVYGRWVKKEEHRGWHGWRGGEFNAWWKAVETAEENLGRRYTKQELLQKLIECRVQFPDTP